LYINLEYDAWNSWFKVIFINLWNRKSFLRRLKCFTAVVKELNLKKLKQALGLSLLRQRAVPAAAGASRRLQELKTAKVTA
jgi:hypothetical protein